MGLDMYMSGRKFLWSDYKNPEKDRKEDGYRITYVEVELGYWRKHPNLHGFIVQAFANGVDKCQEIELHALDLRNIISAIKERRLPHTEGFFFGASDDSEDQRNEDIKILERALEWIAVTEKQDEPHLGDGLPISDTGFAMHTVELPKTMPKESRSVIYRASW